jgi:hypothetical protein
LAQEGEFDSKIGELTKRAFATILNLSSPLANLSRLLPIELSIFVDAVAPFVANPKALGASRSAIQICGNCQKGATGARGGNSRLSLHRQSAVEGKRIASASESILHILLHIDVVRRRLTVIVATVAAHASRVTAGSCGVRRISV